jgi:hypothetical protein
MRYPAYAPVTFQCDVSLWLSIYFENHEPFDGA